MSRMKRIAYLVLMVTVLAGSIIIPAGQASATSNLRVGGSTTIAPIANALESGFESANSDVDVVISEGGSGAGLNGVLDGTLDVGMMSRDLTAAEKVNYPFLIPITVGKDAIAVIVNPSNPISGLTSTQIFNIFSSASTSPVTNWNQVGGSNASIAVHTREDGSGTLDGFKSMALNNTSVISSATPHTSNQGVFDAVAADANAVGFVSLGYVGTGVKAVTVDGVQCTVANAKNSTYPYVRPLNYVTKRDAVGTALKWIYYNLSPVGQTAIDNGHYIKLMEHSRMTIAVDATNSNLRTFAQGVANRLDDGIGMPIDITTFTNIDTTLTQVQNGTIEGAIIYGTLPPAWAGSGLYAKSVTQDASQTKFYIVTKGFGSVDALGAIELYRQLCRDPLGQKTAISSGLYRIWLFGDVTGDELVNSADYASLRSYLLKRVTTLGAQSWLFSADVTGDGLINAADYSILQAYLLRKPIAYPTMPADTSYVNYYPPMP